MKRIFAAIDISVEARRSVSGYIETLRGAFPNVRVGWEKPGKIHLTLKFFGDIDDVQLQNLNEAVEKTAGEISPFKLQISGAGVFPAPRKARILWLGVKDETGSLGRLNENFERECERSGFPRQKRIFTPHLTIARLREPQKSGKLARMHQTNEFAAIDFTVGELIVFQSELLPRGSRYTPIYRRSFSEIEVFD